MFIRASQLEVTGPGAGAVRAGRVPGPAGLPGRQEEVWGHVKTGVPSPTTAGRLPPRYTVVLHQGSGDHRMSQGSRFVFVRY